MELEEQGALLELWNDFLAGLAGQVATAAAMREFYFEVVTHSPHYRYGMAPELFDLLIHGVFDLEQAVLWSARRAADDHQADRKSVV